MGVEVGRLLSVGLVALCALLPTGLLLAVAAGGTPIPVSITSSANPADAGLPFELVANVPSTLGQYFYNWTDSQGGWNSAPSWEVDANGPANLTVTLVVANPLGGRGTATLCVSIRAPPTVTVSSPLGQVDAGVPTPFYIDATGGVPPLTASWIASSGGSNGSAGWPADGNYSEEIEYSALGPAWVLVRLVDALGDPSGTAELLTEVLPGGSLAMTTNGSLGEVGWPVGVEAILENGAPPFHWSLASSLPVSVGPGPFGIFPADGVYRWNISFASAGLDQLNLTTVDALGAVGTAVTTVEIQPPLSVNLTSPGREGTIPFEISANLSGGLPPYSYEFRLSDGEGVNGLRVSPGTVGVNFDPGSPGNYSVEVRVTDELGQTSTSTELLPVEGAPPADESAAGSAPAIDTGALAVAVASILAGLYVYHRHRRSTQALASPERSALPTVRQLMERAQVIDRETLLLLGEEAGEPVESVQTALRTLIQMGEVTTEPGPGNDEVLRWKGAGPPAAASGEDP